MDTQVTSNVDLLTVTVTVIVAVLGWIVALLLQARNTRDQHRIKIQYDIYKQFVDARKEMQRALAQLGAMSPPLVLMKSCMISFQVKLKSEGECLRAGEKEWQEYCSKLYSQYSLFQEKYHIFMYIAEDWTAALKPLLQTRQTFDLEARKITQVVSRHIKELQNWPTSNGRDWRTWDESQINAISQQISNSAMELGMYTHDFMVLIHNRLLAGYFRTYRPVRKTLDESFKVLTEKGIITRKNRLAIWCIARLDKIRAAAMKQSSERQINCVECTTPVMVVGVSPGVDAYIFAYACGHKQLIEGLTLSQKLRAKVYSKILRTTDPYLAE